MRQITLKYSGECRKCSIALEAGTAANYERHIGIFCHSCSPSTEELREYRQVAAEHKASRYDEWAERRETVANSILESHKEIRSDIAFNTQPGHIPFRSRLIAADDRAIESLNIAKSFRHKAARLRNVRVAGDAERTREEKREAVRAWLQIGQIVGTCIYGPAIVKRINQKTATVQTASGFTTTVELSWLTFLKQAEVQREQ